MTERYSGCLLRLVIPGCIGCIKGQIDFLFLPIAVFSLHEGQKCVINLRTVPALYICHGPMNDWIDGKFIRLRGQCRAVEQFVMPRKT